ncbi:MAG: hypothetical protein JXN59_09350 [Anaerolineae bacterium]|nr:hypothetical protein [Anaerolineae bacterium]
MANLSLNQKYTNYTERSAGSAASKFGQLIGTAFEYAVVNEISHYLQEHHPDYEIKQATDGQISRLNMFGGKIRQVDNTITPKDSDDPVALLETKWLKDGRHHNDKGAWILQLREIRKKYSTIRGTSAILIGFWTTDVVLFLMNEGQVEAVRIATDEQIYKSFQPHLDKYLKEKGLPPYIFDTKLTRDKYQRAWDLANFIQWLDKKEKLVELAQSWLLLVHQEEQESGKTGKQKIIDALGTILKPIQAPKPVKWDITIEVDSGNLIHKEFSGENVAALLEEVQEFILKNSQPDNILKIIKPTTRH